MAQGQPERRADPMSLTSILNSEPPPTSSANTFDRPQRPDEIYISNDMAMTPTSTMSPRTPDSEHTLDSISSVWSSRSVSDVEMTGSHSLAPYRAHNEGTFASFSVPRRQTDPMIKTEARSASSSHSRSRKFGIEGTLSPYRSPPTRAPRPKYTDEQPYFIWYHRTDLREPWGVVVEKYRKQFGEVRQKGGLQCKFYRLLDEWQVPKVREQTRQSTDRIGEFGVAERTPQWVRAGFTWMSREHRRQPQSIRCEGMLNPVGLGFNGLKLEDKGASTMKTEVWDTVTLHDPNSQSYGHIASAG